MKELLVDIAHLSQKRCKVPITGLLAYTTRENFLGRVVNGYHPEANGVFLLSRKAAEALCDVQNYFIEKGVSLYFFDGVRPHRAVKDFSHWFCQPSANLYEIERKALHYPHIEKTDLEPLGYASGEVSRHSFGNAVDVSLINLQTGKLLEMGAIFDFFDKTSHLTATVEEIGKAAFSNRELLQRGMQEFGFIPLDIEYWHFEFHEREIDSPLDFVITPELAGIGTYT